MAELITVARPYAEAIFRAAKDAGQLGAISDMLKLAAVIVSDSAMSDALSNPKLSVAEKGSLFWSITGDKVSGLAKNLISALIDNHKTVLLPQVSALFDARKREHESVLKVHLISAIALSDAERNDLIGTIEKRRDRKVEATFAVDESLIGGARLYIGDEVISASARDILQNMQTSLVA